MRAVRRPGLTRFDVLAGVAAFGLVVGLLAPALSKAREAEARARCTDNLKKIGIAAHAYHDQHNCLPYGWLGDHPPPFNPKSDGHGPPLCGPFPGLLPYLEQTALYKKIAEDKYLGKLLNADFDPARLNEERKGGAGLWPWTSGAKTRYNTAAFEAAHQVLDVFQCPSDPQNTLASEPDRHRLYSVGGAVWNTFDPQNPRPGEPDAKEWHEFFEARAYQKDTERFDPLARVNYAGVAGLGAGASPFYDKYEGILTDRSKWPLSVIADLDGTSNTFLFGETCGQFLPDVAPYNHVADLNLFSAVALPTHRGLNQHCAPDAGDDGKGGKCKGYTRGRGQEARVFSFSSNHPIGVAFAFCDGSVRTMRPVETYVQFSPDWYVFQALAGYKDGVAAKTDRLLP